VKVREQRSAGHLLRLLYGRAAPGDLPHRAPGRV